MTSPKGGFYSAEDADSEGEEGKFYVWTEEELKETLGDKDAQIIIATFNTSKSGNFKFRYLQWRRSAKLLHVSNKRWFIPNDPLGCFGEFY